MDTILVIEDDVVLCELIVKTLNSEYTVLSANDGYSGLELAQTHLPALIICDVAMPEMDGYAVLRALRSSESTAGIPFIFLTAFDGRDHIRYGMSLGAEDYIPKPFSLVELRDAIRMRLQRHKLHLHVAEESCDYLRQAITMALPHELRTSLMVINGFTQIMLEELDSPGSEYGDMLRAITAYAQRLQTLSEKFIRYTQAELAAENRRQNADALTIGANDLIHHIAFERARAVQRQNDLRFQLEAVNLPVEGEHLHSVVEELVENALKFSKPDTEICIQLRQQDDHYVLAVTDHGVGMTSDQIVKIGPYRQFNRAKQEQQGTGLGLAIVQRLVQAYRGKLQIDSVPHEFTEVSLWFAVE